MAVYICYIDYGLAPALRLEPRGAATTPGAGAGGKGGAVAAQEEQEEQLQRKKSSCCSARRAAAAAQEEQQQRKKSKARVVGEGQTLTCARLPRSRTSSRASSSRRPEARPRETPEETLPSCQEIDRPRHEHRHQAAVAAAAEAAAAVEAVACFDVRGACPLICEWKTVFDCTPPCSTSWCSAERRRNEESCPASRP